MTATIVTYAPHSAIPAPAMPRPSPPLGTSTSSSATFTTSPATAAGTLRCVTRARPVITIIT